jgi:peptide deformylase
MTQHKYFTIDNKKEEKLLRTESRSLTFPLTAEDKAAIHTLEAQFDFEGNCAGIAAPQLGIQKKIMIFSTPNDPAMKKFRPDWTDSMPKTIWINTSYIGVEKEGMHADYEACLSAPDRACQVSRYKRIQYNAFDMDGNPIHGEANGFLARIIQHETDHLYGALCVDKAIPGTLMTIDEYRAMRKAVESEASE